MPVNLSLITLVASLMRLHGGEFEMFSQKGIGTTATIIFTAKRVIQDDSASSASVEFDEDGDEDGGGDSSGDNNGEGGSANVHPSSSSLQ